MIRQALCGCAGASAQESLLGGDDLVLARWSRRLIALMLLAGTLFAVCGCTTYETVAIQKPMTVRPQPIAPPPVANGSIFQTSSYRPLFEDKRARYIGDTLTININENTAASKTADTATSRAGANSLTIPTVSGLPGKSFQGATLSATSGSTFEGKGNSNATNVFTTTITVTVTEVLENGNLIVSGEKQIGINQGSEYIRFSGVVNPVYIVAGNVVSSSQIADARIEYRGKGYIDEAQTMGWMQRVFQSVLPF
jgi:flagellar L-ring protein precursor FlgH